MSLSHKAESSSILRFWIPASAGMTGERRDGFPLPDRGRGQAYRERRVSGGMDSRSPIGAGDKLTGKDG